MTTDDGGRMSLVEHLTELRQRVVISISAVGVAAVIAYIFNEQIIDLLMDPYCRINETRITDDCTLVAVSPLEGFSVTLTVAGYAGLAFAMPVLLWQLWRFVAPGLYPNEKRYGLAFVFCSFLLFALGAGLAYWSLPRALEFLIGIGGDNIANLFRPKEYIGFVTKMMIGFGIGFEFPIALIFLQLIELVSHETLRKGRRYAVVGIVILVAVLTPSGDPISLMALSVPMYLFYEVAVLFGWWRARKQAKSGEPQRV